MDFFIYILAIIICSKYFKVLKRNSIVIGIKEINKVYSDIFNEKNIIIRFTETLLLFLSETACYISIYFIFVRYVKNISDYASIKMADYGIMMATFIMFHYLVGYILLISTNFHKYMCKDSEQSIQASFLFSYFLISIFLALMLLVPYMLKRYIVCGILSMSISYLINLSILVKIMRNPKCIKINEKDNASFFRVFLAALIVIFMILINLYILVCLVNMIGENAFSNMPNYFDLFYFTVVSFTTVSPSDILPLSIYAKIITMVISFSSFFCISLFLGVLYSRTKK